MANDPENAIMDLVRQVKEAIRQMESSRPDKKLKISKVDLEIKTTLKKEVGASGKVKWLPIPIELSANHQKSEIQTITLSLVPTETVLMKGSVSDELADAIKVIRVGVEEAAKSNPPFDLKEATVSLNIGSTKDGKIQVIVGGGIKTENTHSVKLYLASSDSPKGQ